MPRAILETPAAADSSIGISLSFNYLCRFSFRIGFQNYATKASNGAGLVFGCGNNFWGTQIAFRQMRYWRSAEASTDA